MLNELPPPEIAMQHWRNEAKGKIIEYMMQCNDVFFERYGAILKSYSDMMLKVYFEKGEIDTKAFAQSAIDEIIAKIKAH